MSGIFSRVRRGKNMHHMHFFLTLSKTLFLGHGEQLRNWCSRNSESIGGPIGWHPECICGIGCSSRIKVASWEEGRGFWPGYISTRSVCIVSLGTVAADVHSLFAFYATSYRPMFDATIVGPTIQTCRKWEKSNGLLRKCDTRILFYYFSLSKLHCHPANFIFRHSPQLIQAHPSHSLRSNHLGRCSGIQLWAQEGTPFFFF